MSLVLEKSGGVRVGITHGYDRFEGARSGRVLRMLWEGDSDDVPFADVVSDIRDVLTDPVRKDGVYATALRGYIGSMTTINRGSSEDPAHLQSREGTCVEVAYAAAEDESNVIVADLLVDPEDFVRFVPFAMTRAALEAEDPRLALVEEFKA